MKSPPFRLLTPPLFRSRSFFRCLSRLRIWTIGWPILPVRPALSSTYPIFSRSAFTAPCPPYGVNSRVRRGRFSSLGTFSFILFSSGGNTLIVPFSLVFFFFEGTRVLMLWRNRILCRVFSFPWLPVLPLPVCFSERKACPSSSSQET